MKWKLSFGLLLSLLPAALWAASLPMMTSTPAPGGGQNYSLSLQMLLLMTGLSFIPAMVLMMTSFTRIIIVLSLLRQALGTMQSPPQPGAGGAGAVPEYFRDGANAGRSLQQGLGAAVGRSHHPPAGGG